MTKKDIVKILKESSTGNVEGIKRYKAQYPNFHWTELKYPKTGDTILHTASRIGSITTIEYLLESFNPPAVDCKNNDNKTALHEAAQFCQYESAKTLLAFGANVNALKRADWTPLMLACTKTQDSSLNVVRLLLEHGALVNYRNKDGWTALHLICREGNLDILNLLSEYKTNFGMKTKNGRSALHIAALHGNLEIVKWLCENDVDVNERDGCGNVPVHEAILGNHIDICKYLIERGAEINCRNATDFSLIHLAASQSNMDTIEYVLNCLKFDVNNVTEKGFTPLHCAARKNRKDVFDFLIIRGARDNIKDSFGRLPRDYLALEPS